MANKTYGENFGPVASATDRTLSPISIANGAAKTWTHGKGAKPLYVTVVDSANRNLIPNSAVAVTCSTTTITLTNNSGGAVSVFVDAMFDIYSPGAAAPVPVAAWV